MDTAGLTEKKENLEKDDLTEEQKREIEQYAVHQIVLDVISCFNKNLELIFLKDVEIPLNEAYLNLCWNEFSEKARKELLHDLEVKRRIAIILRAKAGGD